MVDQDQFPRELISTVPMRVAVRPGVTSYRITLAPVEIPVNLDVPAKAMSSFSRCLAVVIVTTSICAVGCVVAGAAVWVGAAAPLLCVG